MTSDKEARANLLAAMADRETKFRKLVTPLGYDPDHHDELLVIKDLAIQLKDVTEKSEKKDRTIRRLERTLNRIYMAIVSQNKRSK